MRVCVHVHVFECMCPSVQARVPLCGYVCASESVCACVRACVCVSVCAWLSLCVSVCVRACVHA